MFQAEALAIREAIKEFIPLRHNTATSVKIFTDSQAALLSTPTIKSRLVHSTIMELNKPAKQGVKIEICWIKAHIGHIGNERADEEARNAETLDDIYTEVPVPFTYFKQSIKVATYELWKQEWIENPTCRMSKIFLPEPHAGKSKEILQLARGQMRRLIEIISGHNNFNYLQSKIYPHDVSTLCRFCEEEDETFDHLIFECPCFRTARQDIFLDREIQGTLDWKPHEL